jgi:hypothetical protein
VCLRVDWGVLLGLVAVQVTSPYGNSMHYAENVQSGHFAFTAAEAGDYLACFWAPDHKPAVAIGFEFDWRSGVSTKDWPSVAKKGKVDVSISLLSEFLSFFLHNSLPIGSFEHYFLVI